MYPKNVVFRMSGMIVLLLCLSANVYAAAVGAFIRVEGAVDVFAVGAPNAVIAKVGDMISSGDAVRTKKGSRAEVRFNDGTTIQIAPETRLAIDQYTMDASGSRERGVLSLFRGKIRAMVSKMKSSMVSLGANESGFNIKTPTAVAGVKGTDFIVSYERGVTAAIFLEGFGMLHNPRHPNQIIPISAGHGSFVHRQELPPTAARPLPQHFLTTYLREFTQTPRPVERPVGGSGGAPILPPVTVVAENTTLPILVSDLGGNNLLQPDMGGSGGAIIQSLLPPGSQPDVTPPPPPPITETHHELLNTQVTVRVTLPH